MNDEDQSCQSDEVEALKSIYFPDELQQHLAANGCCQIWAWVSPVLPDLFTVKYIDAEGEERNSVTIKHLPPIRIRISLPNDYPSKRQPSFKLSCDWLRPLDLRRIGLELNRLWNENKHSPIIYMWIEFLKTETLSTLSVSNELVVPHQFSNNAKFNDVAAVKKNVPLEESETFDPKLTDSGDLKDSDCEPKFNEKQDEGMVEQNKTSIIEMIELYDREQRKVEFLKEYHNCETCFQDKQGKDSVLFEKCNHVACRECMTHYFTGLINEGNVVGVKCPVYRCDTIPSQSQIRELVTFELFEKYDKALLSIMLDSMKDIIYCPRAVCKYPTTRDREEKVAVCPACRFAFCVFCRMCYHGVEPCRLKDEERRVLVENYQQASEPERNELEKRYGKRQLDTLVSTTLSENWIRDNGKTCPHCNVVIEKSEGCNKMVCWRCKTFFCWLCGEQLSETEPYLHFRDPNSSCANKLFQFDPNDDDDWEWQDFVEVHSDVEDMVGEDSDSDISVDL